MRGEVCTLGRFVLQWHHFTGIWRMLRLVFRSLQACLFFYDCFQGVLCTLFLLLFSFHVLCVPEIIPVFFKDLKISVLLFSSNQ